jgi:hypothetical protein
MAKTNSQSRSAAAQRQHRKSVERPRSQQQQKKRKVVRKSNRGTWYLVGGVVVVVAIVVGIFFLASQQSSTNAVPVTPASASVVNAVTHVSPSVISSTGTGGVTNPLSAVKGQPLLKGSNGKPEFFYEGAEYCPFCAAERWPMVVALSRFGTFHNLHTTASSPTDVYPNTPTFTFYQSTYSSSYIDFVSVETLTNKSNGSGSYTTLQTPTAQEQLLFNTYDNTPYVSASSAGSIPFVDIGNKYVLVGASYSPQVLANLTPVEISNDLSNATSPVTKGIIGTANYLTAAICTMTNQQPASVCSQAPMPQIEQTLGSTAFIGMPDTSANLALAQLQAVVSEWNSKRR